MVTLGTSTDLSPWELKRARLINGIAFTSMVLSILYGLPYLHPDYWLTLTEILTEATFMGLVLWINSYGYFSFTSHLFVMFNLLFFTFQAISHGAIDGTEYYLIVAGVVSTLFFKSRIVSTVYFFVNGLFFFLCKYSFTVIQPFLFMAHGENQYYANHLNMIIILYFIVLYFKSENFLQETLLQNEKEKAENLLLNILPEETAHELKETGKAKARNYEVVTVMFSDFKNFSQVAEKLSPNELITEMNRCFSAFDQIIHQYKIEKIKTIGDSYMCASGLPDESTHDAVSMVKAGLEMQDFINQYNSDRKSKRLIKLEMRVGIHTGPLIAGIVGIKKFAYDVWGDTVNIASRMESSGDVGKVNISQATYELVSGQFQCTYRGKIEAKNKGEIDMYFVERVL